MITIIYSIFLVIGVGTLFSGLDPYQQLIFYKFYSLSAVLLGYWTFLRTTDSYYRNRYKGQEQRAEEAEKLVDELRCLRAYDFARRMELEAEIKELKKEKAV